MDGIVEAFEIVFGKEFVDMIRRRLLIILIILAAALLVVAVIKIWKRLAGGKIKKAILLLAEYPDDLHADEFLDSFGHVTPVGKLLCKKGKHFAGLSKDECRNLYNNVFAVSTGLNPIKLTAVRDALISVGCMGLLGVTGSRTYEK